MEIQVRVDNNLPDKAELLSSTEDDVSAVLGAFQRRITRVQVHVADETPGKGGATDIRCQIEVHPVDHEPVVVTHRAVTTHEAVHGAARRMREQLVSLFGRLDRRHPGAESIRTGRH